ncbi:MAG: MoaD/ThiS family protein [Deltaproteobacteria bacterium]|nr:MoaD/ThiS family protein [Deltaproteobacteria bacterium]
MIVSVCFLGMQRQLTQTDQIQVPFLKKMRVADIFNHIKENYPELSLHEEMVLATVNKNVSSLEQRLQPDDEVSFIPHIGGG